MLLLIRSEQIHRLRIHQRLRVIHALVDAQTLEDARTHRGTGLSVMQAGSAVPRPGIETLLDELLYRVQHRWRGSDRSCFVGVRCRSVLSRCGRIARRGWGSMMPGRYRGRLLVDALTSALVRRQRRGQMIGHERVLQEVSLIHAHRTGTDALTYVIDEQRRLDLLPAFLARDSAGVFTEAVSQPGSLTVLELVLGALQFQQLPDGQ